MRRIVIFATMLLMACYLLNACSLWDKTHKVYKKYVNTDPQVDLEGVDFDEQEEKMASLFSPVDTPVNSLVKYLGAKDVFPGDRWFEELFQRYPWISGTVVSKMSGEILQRQPETGLKPLHLAPLLKNSELLRERRMVTFFDDTPLGPEVYLGTGFFHENDLLGALVVYFDIRNLLRFSPNPDDILVFTPQLVLWAGKYENVAPSLLEEPWEEILKHEVDGELETDRGTFFWLARYLGDKQILYATEVVRD
ncbi:MAG: hypothetical protein SVS15_08225 [Thermodesulfobacteriota bacterium]|nr:hypothetical protein [Thermodesulfobacteriota bacterium]